MSVTHAISNSYNAIYLSASAMGRGGEFMAVNQLYWVIAHASLVQKEYNDKL